MKKLKTFLFSGITLLTVMIMAVGCGSSSENKADDESEETTTTKVTTTIPATTTCSHEWIDADCENPKKCKKCGETEGEPLSHKWVEATYDAPKTCSLCGKTEGTPLECTHEWSEATCESPKKCNKCGKTEGEKLPHTWVPATASAPKTCSVCGKTEGLPLPLEINIITPVPKEFSYYDYKGAIRDTVYINEITYDFEQDPFGDEYTLTLYFSGEKSYDVDGPNQGRMASVSIKVTDSDGYVVDDATFYTPSLFVGDKFRQEECKIYDLKHGSYNIELINTN